MANDFQQTVNLQEKMEKQKRLAERKSQSGIEAIYRQVGEKETKKDLQEIKRPGVKRINPLAKRFIVIVVIVLIAGVTIYWLITKDKGGCQLKRETNWYAVTLKTNNEMFYGQICDIKANPVELKNVYYNYDQANLNQDKTVNETGNLRLVKQGKETYGPSGSKFIYQTEIKNFDPLASDSKVLKAILEYEK